MPEEFNIDSLNGAWMKYFTELCQNDIMALANSFPDKRSLEVDFSTIETFDEKLAYFLIDRPIVALYFAELALNTELKRIEPNVKRCNFRIKNLPDKPLARIDVRGLRTRHLGKFVSVQGIVRKMTQVNSRLMKAAFQCARCLAVIWEPQEGTDHKEPVECYKDQGGCGKAAVSTRFMLLTEETATANKNTILSPTGSVSIDSQKIEIQESPEALKGRDQPERLVAYMEDDLCNKIYPGDKVILNGVLRSQQKKNGNQKTNFFNWYLDVNSLEIEEHEFDEVEISAEDEKVIMEMSRDPLIQDKITASIAPTIFGMEHEKAALALQLFGGVTKILPDGARARGDIHILLCGDPGLAKSQLIRYISKLLPRGVFASGKATTGAGLTAAAVRDEFGEGRWTLEAGAMVLADKGGVCIDELDKMNEQDTSSMHEAMESQSISVNKAGISATFQSRCSVLAAANPKNGRFDEHEYLADQIDLSPPLLSRFDAIFPIVDHIDRKRDEDIAGHILKVHLAGEIIHHREAANGQEYSKEDEEDALEDVKPIYSVDTLRKYVAYAKRNICPVMKPDTIETIKDYYVDIRAAARPNGEEGGAVPMTPRQIEAIIRMSEASARMRLSNEVLPIDAERAKGVMQYYLKKVASEGGTIDIDAIATGVSYARVQRFNSIIDVIEEIDDGKGVLTEDILRRVEKEGIDSNRLDRELKRMMRDGRLWSPSEEGATETRYKVMRRG